jgi:hypothetical protein
MTAQISNFLVAANIGIMLFFSVAVAPGIFKLLPPEWAAKYVRAFFPKYYAFLGATTVAAAILASGTALQTSLAVCALVFFFSMAWVTPQVNRARDENRTRAFNILHWLSVALNMLQLIFFIALAVVSVRQ